jgi:Tol biopolymer transport system component
LLIAINGSQGLPSTLADGKPCGSKGDEDMKKRLSILSRNLLLLSLFTCQNRIEPAKTIDVAIPSPTAKTLSYLSSSGLPGWKIMSWQESETEFRLSTGPFDVGHDWSWDKQWIVYERGGPPRQFLQIWKMKYNGDNKTALTSLEIDCQLPAFSPDGQRIVFSAATDTNLMDRHLVITNSDGSGWQQVTTSATLSGFDHIAFGSTSWFPDGTKLVADVVGIKTGENRYSSIGILDLVSGVYTPLPSVNHLSPWLPNLSSTGDKIVFVSGANGEGADIFTVNADGTDLRQLTDTQHSTEPDWSPDGKQIVYSQRNLQTLTKAIRVMNADGTDQKILMPAPATHGLGRPRW